MKQKNITKSSQQAIGAGILDIAFGRYESAEQRFGDVVKDLESRSGRFLPYLHIAAFGQGLAEGMRQRQADKKPRSVAEAAFTAKNFYEAFESFGKLPTTPEKYKTLGRSYAILGLQDEALEVLEFSRRSDILTHYKLYPVAKKLLLE